ncbi:MAG: hypothetical protein JWN02_513, partial [Acidobacteria bacterium]|nr:hypothetical protein [Acidobacteriota bacterium]
MATKAANISAFAGNLIVKALDTLAGKVGTVNGEGEKPSALQQLVAQWQSLSTAEREQLALHVAEAAAATAIPIALAAQSRVRRSAKRVVKKVTAPIAAAAVSAAKTTKKGTDSPKKDKSEK